MCSDAASMVFNLEESTILLRAGPEVKAMIKPDAGGKVTVPASRDNIESTQQMQASQAVPNVASFVVRISLTI